MPVKAEVMDNLLDPVVCMEDFADLLSPASDPDDRISDPLLPVDIWDKFELDFPELQGWDQLLDEFYCAGAAADCKSQPLPVIKIQDDHINHDCMWAGHCSSRQHAHDEPKCTPLVPKPPQIKPQMSVNPQSVLKPTVRAAAAAAAAAAAISAAPAAPPHAPQTPPESDDEENKARPTPVLQILNQAINECDFEDDSDLCEYFEDAAAAAAAAAIQPKEEPAEVKEEPADVEVELGDGEEERRRKYLSYTALAAESDHSYYKDKNATMRMGSLGLDTPSDSEEEEEIDVVSVTDKLILTSYQRMAMPTNPSTRDRHQLQRRMATAITKKRSSGIKTIMPVRKPAAESTPKRKGAKRGRGYRGAAASSSPRKRHHYACSDSEPEPSEKRSLHNNMERQRRIDLRNAFEDLRVLVPEVAKKDRAAKVVILREAALYCDGLAAAGYNNERQKEELKRRQEWLRQRVSQLRRSLAAKR